MKKDTVIMMWSSKYEDFWEDPSYDYLFYDGRDHFTFKEAYSMAERLNNKNEDIKYAVMHCDRECHKHEIKASLKEAEYILRNILEDEE